MSLLTSNINSEHIDNLPDELLLEIFDYFNLKELKIASLVNRRWAEIIGNSASTKKLTLNFMKYCDDPENSYLHRNYSSIKIENSSFFGAKEFEKLKSIGESVQKLTIRYVTFNKPEYLKIILENLVNLKILILISVQFNFTEDIRRKTLAESSTILQNLQLIQSDIKVLEYLNNFQVISFEITNAINQRYSKALEQFLSNQEKLNSMTIENLFDNSYALFENSNNFVNFKFRLKKFSILCCRIRDVESFEVKFAEFLKFQQQIKKLKVQGDLSQQIFKCILVNLHNVEDLEINVGGLPQEISFYDGLKQNRNLKILRLNGTINKENLIGFKGILHHYPNVVKIFLDDTDDFVSNDVFHLISVKLSKLSDLSVLNFHASFTADSVFPCLKSFAIRILKDVNQWRNFIARNDSIECLSVGWVSRDQFTPEIINEITDLRNLRHLNFGGRFIASKRIYETIKKDYKNLRTLQLSVANYDEVQKLKFVFPLEKCLWRPECQYFDEGHDREPLND